jgi:hypothetical protein
MSEKYGYEAGIGVLQARRNFLVVNTLVSAAPGRRLQDAPYLVPLLSHYE